MSSESLGETIAATLSMASPLVRRASAELEGPPASEPLPSGNRRYQVLGELGRGAMGRVVEARDLQFGRHVAVKVLHPDADAETERRFALESLITGNLEHPAIPTVYERGVGDHGAPFYAMRRVPGRTLADALVDAPDLAGRLGLLPVLTRAAHAIAFAHDEGVIHRDIKPQNVLVGPHGETVVVDWGIAKIRGLPGTDTMAAARTPAGSSMPSPSPTTTGTSHGAVMGTPAYMAPEQAAGRTDDVDERSDVFALGAVLYHLLAGRAPYQAASVDASLARAVVAAPEPIRRIAPRAPRALIVVCERAMARRADDRYRSASELAAALEAAAADALAGRESTTVRWFAQLAGAGALVALVLTTWTMWASISSLRQQGRVAFVYTGFAVVGGALSVIEWATRGRHRLAPLALSLALATILLGTAQFAAGLGRVNHGVAGARDPAAVLPMAAQGVFEISGCIASSGTLAAIQLMLWGIARRRSTRVVSA